MKLKHLLLLAAWACGAMAGAALPPPIRVSGRHLVDPNGDCVRLMGVMRSVHPFFDGGRWGGGRDGDAAKRAIAHYEKVFDALADRRQGSYCNLVRLTDDGHWSWNEALKPSKYAPAHTACDWTRYEEYLGRVLVPIVERAVERGLYVIVRPSYNTPGETKAGDAYNRHLAHEWRLLAADPTLRRLAGQVLFELENEPTTVYAADGTRKESALAEFMQPLVDTIRGAGWNGVILVPGMGYQSWYADYVRHPVKDANFGYAVHVYAGWYAQSDETACGERFVDHFLRQVPVVMTHPCVVTEVDWSPIKPGKGKTNEFGQFVPANWGSWATASSSRWGKAYFELLETFGNVSTIAGDSYIYHDIDEYLKSGKVRVGFGGEPECCAAAFFGLFRRWAHERKAKPYDRDRKLPLLPHGEEVALRTVEQLTRTTFRLDNGHDELNILAERNGSWDFQFRPIAPVARNEDYAHLFKAIPATVDGKTGYSLRCYDSTGVVRCGGQDGGNGDAVCASAGWNGYLEGPSRANAKFKYGLERDYDGLWTIEAVPGGFTFRNLANGKYLGVRENPQSPEPVTWRATARLERRADRLAREQQERAAAQTGARPEPTYRNPVIFADVPDVGLCADDEYVYMVSTTMHLMPGAPIMRSRDMITWETVGYGIPEFDVKPDFSLLEGKTGYAGGQWASSLRHHQGKFYLWFVANGCGGFLYTSNRAEGPWKLQTRGPFLHDGSVLFDDDGRIYIFHGSGHVTEMKDDFSGPKPGGLDRQLFERGEEKGLLEGSSVIKKDGYYYLMMVSAFMEGHPRREVCYRTRDLAGEWEKKVILETEFDLHGGVGQGAAVKCPDGRWRALVFQDRGGIGRTPCLMPVRWEDGWPMLGNEFGLIPNDRTKLYPDLSGIAGSDEFDAGELDLRWQWNHRPVADRWSLTERPGWLTLRTCPAAENLFMARNTLTQRMVGPESTAIVRMDVSQLREGDHAGFCAFQGDSAVGEVVVENGARKVVLSRQTVEFSFADEAKRVSRVETEVFATAPLAGNEVWFKVHGNFRRGQDWAEVAWSADGKVWSECSPRVPMRFDIAKFFMGAKFALFNYATRREGGSVAIDFFRMETPEHEVRPRKAPNRPGQRTKGGK
ncbi:MAG: family 43 glycosylhydrolase [Kiritimatiellia bacterium]